MRSSRVGSLGSKSKCLPRRPRKKRRRLRESNGLRTGSLLKNFTAISYGLKESQGLRFVFVDRSPIGFGGSGGVVVCIDPCCFATIVPYSKLRTTRT